MVLLLHFAFKSTSVALCFFRNSPPGSGYFLSFAIRTSQPFDAKKEKEKRDCQVLPNWYLVPFLLAVIWGAIANNVLNLYTAGLGLLALRVYAPRWAAVCVVAAIATILTCIAVFVYNFMSLYAW